MKTLQVERKSGVPRQRIKYYREHGFIPTNSVKVGTRTDYTYTEEDILTLRRIDKLLSIGINLKTIKLIIESGVSDNISVFDQIRYLANNNQETIEK